MAQATALRLTPAQRRFVEVFDKLTQYGIKPADFRSLREELRIQSRTMNYCYRLGLIKKTAKDQYIVDPSKRTELGLSAEPSPIKTIRIKPRKRVVRIMIG